PHAIRGQQIGDARGVHTQRQDHRRRLRAVIGNFIAGSYLHRNTLRYISEALPASCSTTRSRQSSILSSPPTALEPPHSLRSIIVGCLADAMAATLTVTFIAT